jgi:predicted MFS family arabinose efflux permease
MELLAKPDRPSSSRLAVAAVALCGVCAFLELYSTQPLLPLLTRLFHASKTGVSLTVSAATLGAAFSAPIFGSLVERLPRKRVIVACLTGIALPTLLAATSTSLVQLIFWRFLQGMMVSGIVAVVVTYIGEEWPPNRIALVMSIYVSGTALGGFLGRITTGVLADWFSWRVSFLCIGFVALAGACAVAAWLPHGHRRPTLPALSATRLSWFPQLWSQAGILFRNHRLIATYAVGCNVLFSLVAVFTWITFHLSAPPFLLSTAALSSLFFVYLIGLVITPVAGYIITHVGLRAGIAGAIVCSMTGVLLTLAPSLSVVILGLTLVCTGSFISQAASQSHLRVAAPPEMRVTAAGLYITCYYIGGTAAGVVPGIFWAMGKWPACVAFILAMQAVALTIALVGWRMPKEALERPQSDIMPC